MRDHLHGLDHVLVLVRALDGARDAFARLGFTVAPRARHGAEMGTGNHLVVFADDYLELFGVLAPTEFNRMFRDALTVGEGVAAVALRTDDAGAAAAELSALGVPMSPPMPVHRSSAQGGAAAFTITRFAEPVGHLQLFCTEAENRAHTWLPALMTHPNTAWGIDSVVVAAEDPDSAAAELARVLDTRPQRTPDGAVTVAVHGRSIVHQRRAALPGADLPEAGPAMVWIKVEDLGAATRCLRSSGVEFRTTEDGIVVPRTQASGVLLGLREVARPRRPR